MNPFHLKSKQQKLTIIQITRILLINNLISRSTAMILGLDNSQISQQYPEDSSRSQMQDLNNLRQMLPQAISKIDRYFIPQPMQQYRKEESQDESEAEMLIKISQQIQHILGLEEKLYYYRSECIKLMEENHQIRSFISQQDQEISMKDHHLQQLSQKLEAEFQQRSQLQKNIREKQHKISELRQKLQKLQKVDVKKERQLSFRNSFNHQMISQELLLQQKIILELTAKNEKIVRINTFLEGQLRMAQQKLVNLEIQIQEKVCNYLVDNVSRLKDNKNQKSNYHSHSNNHFTSLNKKSYQNTNKNQEISENKTIKLLGNQDGSQQEQQHHYQDMQFKTIQKQRLFKQKQMKFYDPKLTPIESPKPQRKSYRVLSINNPIDVKNQKYRRP